MKNLANLITGSRILFSLLLVFVPVFSLPFYFLYCIGGITDMVDGPIARKTDNCSAFGAKLDSIADFVFLVICLIKFLPTVQISGWLWGVIGLIFCIKLTALVLHYRAARQLCFPHTIANKITGGLLFLLGFWVGHGAIHIAAIPVCLSALFAAGQELYFAIKKAERD